MTKESKQVTGFNLSDSDKEKIEAYSKELCTELGIENNLSHTMRYVLRNPKAYTDWLAQYESTNKKQESRSAKSDA